MKVLVTGTGSLLLGGIASELVRRGDDVVCLQRRTTTFIGHQDAREVLADIRDADAVAQPAGAHSQSGVRPYGRHRGMAGVS